MVNVTLAGTVVRVRASEPVWLPSLPSVAPAASMLHSQRLPTSDEDHTDTIIYVIQAANQYKTLSPQRQFQSRTIDAASEQK